ncbi:MAG: hypothetical protein ACFFD9_05640 [Candidatus Thorarchaeota archaeon]
MGFWLDTLPRRLRLPYPIFFGLVALVIYVLGMPVMIFTGNLTRFLAEPRWILLQVYGAFSAISVVFVFREFLDSLDRIAQLVSSEEEFQGLQSRTVRYLTHWAYWFVVLFWIVLNLLAFFAPTGSVWTWYGSYDQPLLVTLFYQIVMLPANVFGGVFTFVVPIGLTLAYRELCVNTSFNQSRLRSEWMTSFGGFRNLITLGLFVAGINAVLTLLIWTGAPPIFSYGSILVIVVPTLIFPHYYFHVLFSQARRTQLVDVRQQLLDASIDWKKETLRRVLLLLEEARIERKKTWLIDVVTMAEILIVALMHVLLVETITLLFHI